MSSLKLKSPEGLRYLSIVYVVIDYDEEQEVCFLTQQEIP